MSLLALFAALTFLLGVALLLCVMWLLRAVGALGRQLPMPQWLNPTLSGAFDRWGDPQKACAARRDPVYHGANLGLVALGTLGIALFSASTWTNIALAVAYLGASVVFFRVVYGVWACRACYYVREAHSPFLAYRAAEERAFRLRYRSALLAWSLLVWMFPMTLMAYGAWALERTIELPLLAVMLAFASTVFVPVLALRICDRCRINTLGMCPMPWRGLVARSVHSEATASGDPITEVHSKGPRS